jgi:acyl-CoA synthetase (AMP-forming)/AMP-acid ligase II
MEVTRLFDILDLYKTTYTKDDLLCAKEDKHWKKYSSNDFINRTNWVSSGLFALGLNEGDRIAIISNNRPEWNFCDFGCQQANMISVPIFPTISNHDLQFILNHAGVKAVFISDKLIYTKLAAIEKEIPEVKFVISFNPLEGIMPFGDFLELGKTHAAPEKIESIKARITPDDMMTILYTSGTTGTPKGVMISHRNLVSNLKACQFCIDELIGDKYRFYAGMVQDELQVVVTDGWEDRHRDHVGLLAAEVAKVPFRPVVGNDGDPVALVQAQGKKSGAHPIGAVNKIVAAVLFPVLVFFGAQQIIFCIRRFIQVKNIEQACYFHISVLFI